MGSGFVVPLMKRWPESKIFHYSQRSELGDIEYNYLESNILLVNMIAQKGIITDKNNTKPIKYEHLVKCMVQVRFNYNAYKDTGHELNRIIAPKFGSLRAGGNWKFIEELINEIWADIPVTIFEYKE
jgi:hypothetical protein